MFQKDVVWLDSTSDQVKNQSSRLANLAAGTKSLSPAIKIIWSTYFFNVIDAMSNPIAIKSIWVKSNWTSFSVKSLIAIFPFKRSLVLDGLIIHLFYLLKHLILKLLSFFSKFFKKSDLKFILVILEKSKAFPVTGLCCFLSYGKQS